MIDDVNRTSEPATADALRAEPSPLSLTRRRFLELSLTAAGASALAGTPIGRGLLKGSSVSFLADIDIITLGPTLVQSPWLAMIGLGDNVRSPAIDRGNHLRWAFHPALGFPPGGFDLYRRPHVRPTPVCVEGWPQNVGLNLGTRAQLDRLLLTADADMKTVDVLPVPPGRPEIDLRGLGMLSVWPDEVCRQVVVGIAEVPSGGSVNKSVQVIAYDRGVPVASAETTATAGEQLLALTADRIDRVVVRGWSDVRMNAVLTQVCWATVVVDLSSGPIADAPTSVPPTANPTAPTPNPRPPTSGPPGLPLGSAPPATGADGLLQPVPIASWVKLNREPICLPLSSASYPCSLPASADEEPLAQRRSTPGDWPALQPHFPGLRDTLDQIYSPILFAPLSPDCSPDWSTAAPNSTVAPDMAPDPLGLVLMTTLDANIARVVGLYWIDGAHYVSQGLQVLPAAAVGERFDYLIVGHYGAVADTAELWDLWRALGGPLADGPLAPGVDRPHGPFVYTNGAAVPLPVVVHAVGAYGTVAALHLADNLGQPLSIRLPARMEGVELSCDVETGGHVIARAYRNGEVVDTMASPAGFVGATTLLLLGEGIDRVELEGRNAFLAKTSAFVEYTPHGDLAWVVHDIALGTPAPLPSPATLSTTGVPVLTGRREDCTEGTEQMAGALRWAPGPLPGGLLPSGTVAYHIDRSPRGSGASAASSGAWQMARRYMVASEPSAEACAAYRPLPGWPALRPDLVDIPPGAGPNGAQDRWYAYRVQATDLFARTSTWVETAPPHTNLSDTVAPPPPADVRAKYLDPDDPQLLADETVWTAGGGSPRHGLRVGWRWPDNMAAQAPDLAQFRVYLQSGRLNVIVGAITAVLGPDPSGDVTVVTDVPASALALPILADDFAGERLVQGVNLYPIRASAVQGGQLTFTYRRIVWSPPAGAADAVYPELQPLPITGPFSLALRPPKPLEGMVTEVIKGMAPSLGAPAPLTVRTNVRLPGAPNTLAGTLLVQGGALWPIASNDAGWQFALRTQTNDCAPSRPLDGAAFRVLDASGTPVLLDAGNRHWRDFGAPLSWSQRLHVEPWAGGINGIITGVTNGATPGTVVVTTDAANLTPSDRYIGGELEVGRETYPVIGRGSGPTLELTILTMARDRVTGTVLGQLPAPGAPFRYWPDIVLPFTLPIPAGAPEAYAAVSVSAADDKAYVPDPRSGGGQTGNEGSASSPAIVVRLDRTVPAAPSVPSPAFLMATPADFHDRSFVTVRWPKLAAPGLRYQVLRALEDREDLVVGSGATAYYDPLEDAYRLLTPEALPPEDLGDIVEPDHPALDTTLLAYTDALDGRTRSRAVYRVRAVSAAGVLGTLSGPLAVVACPDILPPATPSVTSIRGGEDSIRIAWVATGEADLDVIRVHRAGDASLATDIRDMGPPVALVPARVLRVAGGAVRMAHGGPLPAGMGIDAVAGVFASAGFLLDPPVPGTNHLAAWSGGVLTVTGLADGAEVVVRYADAAGALHDTYAGGGEHIFVDGARPPRRPFTYRLVATDTSSNVSLPSLPATGQAYREALPPPPSAPALSASWQNAGGVWGVDLAWGWPPGAPPYASAVQRKSPSAVVWQAVSEHEGDAWLPPGTTAWRDASADDDEPWDYRLRVRDEVGNVNSLDGPLAAPIVGVPARV